jgi:hypothetical protein
MACQTRRTWVPKSQRLLVVFLSISIRRAYLTDQSHALSTGNDEAGSFCLSRLGYPCFTLRDQKANTSTYASQPLYNCIEPNLIHAVDPDCLAHGTT